jgi:hypothetical protein
MKRGRLFLLFLVLFGASGPWAKAQLLIDATFESSITSNPNAVEIEAGINQAISRLESDIATPVTVAIDFASMSGGLGESSTYEGSTSYTSFRSQLASRATSAEDAQALATLPVQTNNPVNGDANVEVTTALFRALGFNANPPAGQPDSTISLNLSLLNLSRTGAQNPSDYDLQAVVTHEMDEVLGSGGAGSQLNYAVESNGNSTTGIPVGPMDLFRYSAAGVRSFSTSSSVTSYFSINGGVTNLVGFNQQGASGSDFGDWATGVTPQVQDAYGTPGVDINLGSNELKALDVVGWTLTPQGLAIENGLQSVPEPRLVYLLPIGLLALGIYRRQRRMA